jgi:hypothetical protein
MEKNVTEMSMEVNFLEKERQIKGEKETEKERRQMERLDRRFKMK